MNNTIGRLITETPLYRKTVKFKKLLNKPIKNKEVIKHNGVNYNILEYTSIEFNNKYLYNFVGWYYCTEIESDKRITVSDLLGGGIVVERDSFVVNNKNNKL